MSGPLVVAIDGPSGSGKSSVARAVGEALGLPVLDTGAMYRAVTLAALEAQMDLDDADALAGLAARTTIGMHDDGRVTLDGRDVTGEIRDVDVTAAVSTVSAHPAVRAEMIARQRAWLADHGGGVVEGRDIGTVVFPDAPVKVFLHASDEERARRRQRDEEAANRSVTVERVREAMQARDAKDSSRSVAPLTVAEDAVVIDTTGVAISEVVGRIVERVKAVAPR